MERDIHEDQACHFDRNNRHRTGCWLQRAVLIVSQTSVCFSFICNALQWKQQRTLSQ